jgi:hypothetical protein
MGRVTLEAKAVPGTKLVFLAIVKNDFQLSSQHVKEFFALVRISFSTARARGNAKQVGFQDSVAPGQEFHSDPRTGFQQFSL